MRALLAARKKQMALDEAVSRVFELLSDAGVNLEAHSNAENADSVGTAVTCYIHYGEYGIKNLMSEIEDLVETEVPF